MVIGNVSPAPAAPPKTSPAPARWTPVAQPKCLVCDKSVYENEKLTADGKTWHKTCFRCKHCKKVLSLGNYAAVSDTVFCKPHFKQLFAEGGGSYASMTGEADPKRSWSTNKASGTEATSGSGDKSASPGPAPSPSVKALMGKFGGVSIDAKCPACDKTAYAAEAVDVDGAKWHKGCFRCAECRCSLSLMTVVQCEGKLWCTRDAPRNRHTKHMDGSSMEIRGAAEAQKLAQTAISSPDVVARYSTNSSSAKKGPAPSEVTASQDGTPDDVTSTSPKAE